MAESETNVLSKLFHKESFCDWSIGLLTFVNRSNKTLKNLNKLSHTTDGLRDLATELAQWAHSVKIG